VVRQLYFSEALININRNALHYNKPTPDLTPQQAYSVLTNKLRFDDPK
jgi:hypothetical protein